MFENLSSLFSALGLGYLVLTAWPLAKTDILERRLPNKYVLPAFPITWLGQLLAGFTGAGFVNMLWALLAGVVTFGLSLLINRLGLLGMGDVKLMTVMALALGWFSPLLPIIALGISFLTAGVVAFWLLLRKKIKLGGSMPLGPYLIAGFLGAVTLAVWS
ncbi:CpaA Flp pilus assembly protein, protease CpaA [Microbacteriaceae bacterium]